MAQLPESSQQPNAQNAKKPNTQNTEAQTSDSVPAPATDGHSAAGGQKKEHECRYDGPKWFAGFYCFFAAHEKFWVAFGTVILAAVTLILGTATVFLYLATRALVRGAEITAERQLRAYVLIQGADIRLASAHAMHANVSLKNFGQTPGYDFQTWTLIRVSDPANPPYAERGTYKQKSIIGPDADFQAGSDYLALRQGERKEIEEGKKMIFLWGEAAYTDTFGKRWIFDFRSRATGAMIQPKNAAGAVMWHGWGVSPHPEFGYSEREG